MVGQQFSHYRVLALLGRGGMGEVYLAEDASLGRKVALKFARADLTPDPRHRARLTREARSAARLDHPAIGTVYEIGECDGRLFIAMAYVEGETLRQRLDRGPLEVGEVDTVLAQVVAGLAEAHAAGILHRDLKPSNVMLTPAGKAKILDFGLAKLTGEAIHDAETAASQLTNTGEVVGTVTYMSPEQARGEAVDHRSDLWSLGVMAYEMLAGRRPFEGASRVAMLSRILTADPPPLAGLRPELPARLSTTVARLLEKDPARRPQSAADVAALLAGGSSPPFAEPPGAPPLPTPVDLPAAGEKWEWRRLAVGLAGVTAAAALAVVFLTRTQGESHSTLAGAPSLVALPCQVYGAEEMRYLSDAVPGAITTLLARVPGLTTKFPPTSFQVDPLKLDLGRIAAAYQVASGLTCRADIGANRLILSFNLVDLKSGTLRWSEEYRDGQQGYMGIVRTAADSVRRALLPGSAPLAAPSPGEDGVEALFREGLFYENRYNNLHHPEDFERARSGFERVLEAEPRRADAAANLARLNLLRIEAGEAPAPLLPVIADWANRALAIDPKNGLASVQLAFIETWAERPSWRRALEYALRAARYAPDDTRSHNAVGESAIWKYSWRLCAAANREAYRLDPLNLYSVGNEASIRAAFGDVAGAMALYDRALEIEPEFAFALTAKAATLVGSGRIEEGERLLGRVDRESLAPIGRWAVDAARLDLLLARGERAEVVRRIEELHLSLADPSQSEIDIYVIVVQLAPVLARHGKVDQAVALLEGGLKRGITPPYDLLLLGPEFARLRDDPRVAPVRSASERQFQDMVEVLKLARNRGELPAYLEAELGELAKEIGFVM